MGACQCSVGNRGSSEIEDAPSPCVSAYNTEELPGMQAGSNHGQNRRGESGRHSRPQDAGHRTSSFLRVPGHAPSELNTIAVESTDVREISPDQIQIDEKIGEGNTANVYKGTLTPGGAMVAIKQMAWDKSVRPAARQRAIERELAIMSRVSHTNLVRFIGVMSLQKPFSIITEYCAGGCLFEFLYNTRCDLAWLGRHKMCLDVARAMHYLHAFNPQIVHRDLKSLNLLLLQGITSAEDIPHLKVADFGLSRMQDEATDAGWGMMTMNAGTPFWMAPEVVRGTSYNEKVDVYSYSMVLFEVICREIPFEEEEPSQVAFLAVAGKRPDLEAVPEDCPEVLRALMIRCWAPDPDERPSFIEISGIVERLHDHLIYRATFQPNNR